MYHILLCPDLMSDCCVYCSWNMCVSQDNTFCHNTVVHVYTTHKMNAAMKKSKEMFKKGKYDASQEILGKVKRDKEPTVREALVLENNDLMNKLMWVWFYVLFMKEIIVIKIWNLWVLYSSTSGWLIIFLKLPNWDTWHHINMLSWQVGPQAWLQSMDKN